LSDDIKSLEITKNAEVSILETAKMLVIVMLQLRTLAYIHCSFEWLLRGWTDPRRHTALL